ncbi:MAG: glycosyltransferase [Pseudonocardiaceae bacterium]
MVRVLLDATVDSTDGIGRYTRWVAGGLSRAAPPDIDVVVRPASVARRYSRAAGRELLSRATDAHADLVHLLDYRVPVTAAPELATIVTVHDVLRVLYPDLCYSDADFAARSGEEGLADLRDVVADLREVAAFPAGRSLASAHEEYLGRMLALAVTRAERVITPTATVASALCGVTPAKDKVFVSSWGVDHLPAASGAAPPGVPDRYVLYVGQARQHKGLPALLAAVTLAAPRHGGLALMLAGRDFTPAGPAARSAAHAVGDHRVVALGEVSDAVLAQLYTGATALVHLADHEGFGFPPLEALAHGCPVLAADIPVLRETLGPHAVFADRHDPEDVITRLEELIAVDGPVPRAERVAWAHRFQWSRHVDDLLACYRQLGSR